MTDFTVIHDNNFVENPYDEHFKILLKTIGDRDAKIAELIRFQEQELCFKAAWTPINELTEEHKNGRWIFIYNIKKAGPPFFIEWDDTYHHWSQQNGILFFPDNLKNPEEWFFIELPNIQTDKLEITEEWVGKYVLLRDGDKGYIVGIAPFECDQSRVFGALLSTDELDDGEWQCVWWELDGHYERNKSENPWDIIGLLEE